MLDLVVRFSFVFHTVACLLPRRWWFI